MRGLQFGYPPCCVGEFVIRNIKNTHGERERRKFHGTGYVLCVKCNQRSKAELLSYIEANRHFPKPFPEHD